MSASQAAVVSERPNVQQAVPFFRVASMDASLQFYVAGLGFAVTNRWIDGGKLRWCWMELGGAALMLQELTPPAAGEGTAASPLGRGVAICFMCQDALAIYRDATARGLTPQEPFVGNGLWVTGFVDPDGYRLDFESPTDVAEDTTLGEHLADQPLSRRTGP
jgi:catechol 2,3-dioxygenase-like lactoylglutathione lyase family enzyme